MKRVDFLDERAFGVLDALTQNRHYLRELADKTGLAPSTVFDTLSKFKKHGMVKIETAKNKKIFSPDYGSPLTTGAVSLLFLSKILDARGFSGLIRLRPTGVYLFGTAHSGKMTRSGATSPTAFK